MQAIDTEFILPFIDATKSTFEVALQKPVQQKEVYVKMNDVMFGDISGSIAITGSQQGAVALSLPGEFAMICIRDLIGEEQDATLKQSILNDGLGEIVNMIASGAKTTLDVAQFNIDLGEPKVISGRGHKMDRAQGSCTTSVIFATDSGEEFSLDICTLAN